MSNSTPVINGELNTPGFQCSALLKVSKPIQKQNYLI